jgi:hypothetical protein
MKRSVILSTTFAAALYIALGSNSSGPAKVGNGNRTGSAVASGTCGSCHGGGSGTTTLTIALKEKASGNDAAGKYTPGTTYTVSLNGNNAALSKFGFQLTAMSSGNHQAGTFGNLGTDVQTRNVSNISVAEQQHTLSKANGVFLVQFDWTAPAAGTGAVTFNGIFNAVDGNSQSTGDAVSLPASLTVNENATTGINEVKGALSFGLFPNPASALLHVKTGGSGEAIATLLDVTGKTLQTVQLAANQTTAIGVAHLPAGTYFLQVQQDGRQAVQQWVKQ